MTTFPDDLPPYCEEPDVLDLAACPAKALNLNQVRDNEVGRIVFSFNDKGQAREVCFMASELQVELDSVFDAIQTSDGFSSFSATIRLTDGTETKTKQVGVDFMEWMFRKPITDIMAAARKETSTPTKT